jgi:hypothetical protein
MKRQRERLSQLNHAVNTRKRKANSDMILLFIAETMTETNGNIKWLMAMVGVALTILIVLAVRGG